MVTGGSLQSVAKLVIQYVRLPLLDPEVLSEVELQNNREPFIPVSTKSERERERERVRERERERERGRDERERGREREGE